MIVLACFLFVMDVIFFRADGGGNIRSTANILKGLNSNTFNYLQANSLKNLGLEKPMHIYDTHKLNVTSVSFFANCVKLNKPCVFKSMAESWPAMEKWKDLTYL